VISEANHFIGISEVKDFIASLLVLNPEVGFSFISLATLKPRTLLPVFLGYASFFFHA